MNNSALTTQLTPHSDNQLAAAYTVLAKTRAESLWLRVLFLALSERRPGGDFTTTQRLRSSGLFVGAATWAFPSLIFGHYWSYRATQQSLVVMSKTSANATSMMFAPGWPIYESLKPRSPIWFKNAPKIGQTAQS